MKRATISIYSILILNVGLFGCKYTSETPKDQQIDKSRSSIALNQSGSQKSLAESHEWIAKLFQKINKCTPNNLYFDHKTGESNTRLFEAKGYRVVKIDEHSAIYKINEKFYGADAFEFSIPTGTDSIYTVKTNASAQELAGRISQVTGDKPLIYYAGPAGSGRAYVVPLENNQSMFVCYTFEEGL